MKTIVLEFSDDQDIIGTQVHPDFNPIGARYNLNQVQTLSGVIDNGDVIVVIAHGNNQEIGNADEGVEFTADDFINLIDDLMKQGAVPSRIYISACAHDIAAFTAAVRIEAENRGIWNTVRIFGHSDPVAGQVPSPNTRGNVWVEIFHGPVTNEI